MKAKSLKATTPESLQTALEQAAAEGLKPTLGLVFVLSGFDFLPLAAVLDAHGIAIFGAHTPDKFTDQGMENEQVTLLLMDLDPSCFRIVLKSFPCEDYKEGVHIAGDIARMGMAASNRPAFIVSVSEFTVPGESLAEGILSVAGEATPVMGGFSGGKPYSVDHVVFTNQEQSRLGVICLILDQDRVAVEGMAVSGWKPAGTLKTVTRSEGNWVFTIDNEPALDVLLRFTGAKVNLDDGDDLLRQIGNSHPLQVVHSQGSPVMKPPLMFNRETGAVMCGGHIPEGAQIRFSLPPDFDIVETVIDSAREAKARAMPEADALLVFSCVRETMIRLSEIWQ